MSNEVLEWLRADSVFCPGSSDFRDLAISFTSTGDRKNVKVEAGRKFILAGAVGGGSCSTRMCTLDLTKDLPSHRLQAWFRAWRQVNEARSCLEDGLL
jgi:hypothetical protein